MKTPSQLFIVSRSQSTKVVKEYLQEIFCIKENCKACISCIMIEEKRHHSVMWIHPEKRYTLDAIEDVFKKTNFELDSDQKFFFILEKADYLTPACANSLLKIVEEPPSGFHFIFIAQKIQLVLSTIRSRCTIVPFTQENEFHKTHSFLKYFIEPSHNPLLFLKEISQTKISEIDSLDLVDTLLEYWTKEYSHETIKQDENKKRISYAMVSLLKSVSKKPIMPGSTKIFWRNLFIKKSKLNFNV